MSGLRVCICPVVDPIAVIIEGSHCSLATSARTCPVFSPFLKIALLEKVSPFLCCRHYNKVIQRLSLSPSLMIGLGGVSNQHLLPALHLILYSILPFPGAVLNAPDFPNKAAPQKCLESLITAALAECFIKCQELPQCTRDAV